MTARIAHLYRHPLKGFTPERRGKALLEAGGYFPCDRLFAVEVRPSGYDPRAPSHVPKSRLAQLANIAGLACVRTAYEETTGVLRAARDGGPTIQADLSADDDRSRFAAWLGDALQGDAPGPLRLIEARGEVRFTDDPEGHVSLINLESVRDLARQLDRPVDPLRFRANVYVEGWPAWSERGRTKGARVRLGEAEAEVFAPIGRCAATHVDPTTGARDLETVETLRALYGQAVCGLYLRITRSGWVREGDAAAWI